MTRSRVIRTVVGIVAIAAVAIVLWLRLPGRVVDPMALDYINAFDDPASRCIIVTAAFDAGSFAVIDSCTHQWSAAGELTLEFRSKLFRSRDGRSIRIGAFRVPYSPTGGVPPTFAVRGGTEATTRPIELMPTGFTTLVPVVDSTAR